MKRSDFTRAMLGMAIMGWAGTAMTADDATSASPGELRDFQLTCLKIGRALFPAMDLSAPTDDTGILRSGEIELSLENVRRKFLLSDRSESALTELMERHLSLPPAMEPEKAELSYEQARPHLLPQLVPGSYVEWGAAATSSFADPGLLVGIVIDHEKNYQYVRQQDLDRWKQNKDALLEIAVGNLDTQSRSMEMDVQSSPSNRLVSIATKDGFDAARILIPGLREFLGTKLGMPFLFGIPNRDFLICWGAGNSAKFQEFVRKQIAEDFRSEPYPLSDRVFEVTKRNEIRLKR